MTRAILEAGLVGQQPHEPPAGVHVMILVGAVVVGIVLFGVSWWRRRRDATAARQESSEDE